MILAPLWMALSLGLQTLARRLLKTSLVPFSKLPPRHLVLTLAVGLSGSLTVLCALGTWLFSQPFDQPSAEVKVLDASAAAEAGLETGDVITSVNGTKVTSFVGIIEARGEPLSAPVEVAWTHAGEQRRSTLTPRAEKIGLASNSFTRLEPSVGDAIATSISTVAFAPRWAAVALQAAVNGKPTPLVGEPRSTHLALQRAFPPATVAWWVASLGELMLVALLALVRRSR